MLDTDVIRSGLQSASGASRLLIYAAFEGLYRPIVTVSTMFEYEAVLARPEARAATGFSRAQVADFLRAFLEVSDQVLVVRTVRPSIQDPADEIFVEAFINGEADAIATFNRRDYLSADPRAASRGLSPVRTLSPSDALRRLPWRPKETMPFVFPRH